MKYKVSYKGKQFAEVEMTPAEIARYERVLKKNLPGATVEPIPEKRKRRPVIIIDNEPETVDTELQ